MKKKLIKGLVIAASIIVFFFAAGFIGLKVLQHQLEEKITGCKIENRDFYVTIPFEYVSNWIVIKAKLPGINKEYPFIFDTGAQTVFLDTLLKELGEESFEKFTFKEDSVEHAFNNELISLNEIMIDKLVFREIGALSANNSKWEMLNCISAYGIIGYNILQNFYSQIDYNKKQIILTDNIEKLPYLEEIQWIDYMPSPNQESPIIKATLNDSIDLDLFFDTGNSGGINLVSSELYEKSISENIEHTRKYISRPSLRIRGEKNEIKESIILKASNIAIGDFNIEDIHITVSNKPEGEYSGLIGNKFFKNFIITLDYKNKRIGFVKQNELESNNNTFGFNYIATEDNIIVSSVLVGSEAYKLNINPGDIIYSINGIYTIGLDHNMLCSVYRDEYVLINYEDSILELGIFKNGEIINYTLPKQNKFNSNRIIQ